MALLQLLILILPMVVLMATGLPIFLCIGITCLVSALIFHLPLMVLAQSFVKGLSVYEMLALPFFFLAGDLMNAGGITNSLVGFAQSLLGRIRGSLSQVTVVSTMIFSGCSGSEVCDASAIGSVLIPAMKKQGLPAAYAATVVTAAATVGPLVPPSIPLVLYSLLTQLSLGRLFLAGTVPGVLLGVFMLVVTILVSYRRNYPASGKAGFVQIVRSFFASLPALIMPCIILGGIVSGVVTATEAGAVAVVYALLVGCFVYKNIKIRDLPRLLGQTMINTATITIIVAASGLFCWIIANMGLGDVLIKTFTSVSTNPWVILAIINVFFLLWGCFFPPVMALLIVVPLLLPLVNQVGIDPVHFGVVVVLNLGIGLMLPPMGLLLYLTSSMAGVKPEAMFKELVPFLIAVIMALALFTYVPAVVLWLPNWLMK